MDSVHEPTPAAGAALERGPKQWFELACRRCGARFVEMKDLAWHRCPGSASGECVLAAHRGT